VFSEKVSEGQYLDIFLVVIINIYNDYDDEEGDDDEVL
jgi:hypothetical protein